MDRARASHAPLSRSLFRRQIEILTNAVEELLSTSNASQADIDAVAAQLIQDETDLATVAADTTAANATLQAELDKLFAQISAVPGVNISAVQSASAAVAAAIAPLDAAIKATGGLTPTPATPPPVPPAPPSPGPNQPPAPVTPDPNAPPAAPTA